MVLGPTEVEREILDIASEPLEYMRTEDYSQKWEQIFSGLKYVFQTKNPVVVFSSSGTGAMEAAVTNFLSANDSCKPGRSINKTFFIVALRFYDLLFSLAFRNIKLPLRHINHQPIIKRYDNHRNKQSQPCSMLINPLYRGTCIMQKTWIDQICHSACENFSISKIFGG